MDLLAIWLIKGSGAALRLIGRRGNALPGLLAERLFPRFLPRVLGRLPRGVVVVSGTNGKTTTTKMLATILAQDLRVLTNDTGSNFVRGAITAVGDHATWRGRIDADVAVFELDEAHAVRFVEVVRPQRVLLLNVMRDQLDRFGEIDTTARLLQKVAGSATEGVVVNRDDPRLAALAATLTAPVSYYGVAPALRSQFPTDEELYGVAEDAPTTARVPAAAELLDLSLGEASELRLRIGAETFDVLLRAGGAHNAQNAAGAAAMALSLGLSPTRVAGGLRLVEPAFGRGQTFAVEQRRLVLHLVKNPAGFRQTLRTLAAYDPDTVMIAINDDYADGRDVSWLWDVDFTVALSSAATGRPVVVTSGTRAADMALRLHYDDLPTAAVVPHLRAAVLQAVRATPVGATVVVLSTYTAMWALHAILLDEEAFVGRAVGPADGASGTQEATGPGTGAGGTDDRTAAAVSDQAGAEAITPVLRNYP